jgi:hypothetical protein
MSKLAIAIAAGFTLLLTGHAEATATAVKPETNYSLIERTGCWWPLQCAMGRHQVCYMHGHCQCVPCSGHSWFYWWKHDE